MASVNSSPKNNEKFVFKCDQHAAIISDKLRSFYEENEFFDTDLIAGNNCVPIKAHKVVLCALSEYFLEIFRGGQSTLKPNILELKEIEASTLQNVIDFMYLGSIELSLETVEGLLRTSLFLKIKTLVDGCCELIEKTMNSSNSLKSIRLANELSLPKLKAKALECTYTYFEEISKEKELLMLSKNELMDLLFNDNPHGDIEEHVFLAMVSWINYDKSSRQRLAPQLLSMIRFQALTPKFIVENRQLVCKTIKSYELICSWLEWHLSPETRKENQVNCDFKPRKIPGNIGVIKVRNVDKIQIETFKPTLKSWSKEIESTLPRKRQGSSIIVIGGKLIVVGGSEDYCWSNQAEYLNLKTLNWIDLPQMKTRRMCCQLIDLKGNLCVYGADVYKGWNSMEIYNFNTNNWHDVQLPSQPSNASQITAYNGILYILDFENGFLQYYDVSSNEWTSKIVKKDFLTDFGFCAVEGFLYVFGGHYECDSVKTVKRYDLSDDSWCEMASLPQNHYTMKTIVFENKIIVCSSCEIDEYMFDTDTWNTLSPLTKDVDCEFVNICILPVKMN